MTSVDFLPSDLAGMVDGELAKGEQIAWVGQPIAVRWARMSLPFILFGIPWTAFAIFWIAAASSFKGPEGLGVFGLFPLFGVPFVVIGLGMLSSPYWLWRKALRTAYVVTDRRTILIEGHLLSGFTVRSFEPDRLHDLQRTQYPDGSGNLVFERQFRIDRNGNSRPKEVGFLAIDGVKDVENLIRELARRSLGPGRLNDPDGPSSRLI
jgi:hypothetical protein